MNWVQSYFEWRPKLIEALDERYYPATWLDERVMQERAFIMAEDDCALIAELRFYPSGARDLLVVATAGDPIATRDKMVPKLVEWAKAHGCLAIIGESREAWAKILKPAGFEIYTTAVRKELV